MPEFETTGLFDIGDMVVDALIDEFVQQGHNNTGDFVRSIVREVEDFGRLISIDFYFNKYGIYQDKGVKPANIPYSYRSGAGSSKYIQALIKWVTQRGIVTNQKQAQSMAFAIARKHKKEGMPTRGSYQYSLNGRRLGFATETFTKLEPEIESRLIDYFGDQVQFILFNIIDDVQKTVKNA